MYEDVLHDMMLDIFESFHYAIITDTQNRIIFFGKDYAELLGVRVEDVIGRDVREVIKNTRMPTVLENNQEESGKIFFATSDFINKRGNRTHSQVTNWYPIHRGGKPGTEPLGVFASGVVINLDDVASINEQVEALKRENELISSQLKEIYQGQYTIDSIIGSSAPMIDVKDMIRRVSRSDITVTIYGDTGTGKELVASAIHYASSRKNKPFVKVNCAAIPQELIESELFGYEPGAYTGASKKGAMGKFELANHGTILLDEIGDMPLEAQTKLLRVLQEKEVTRIGGNKPIPVDIRILCSTNRDLLKLSGEGRFRSDLFYRINVMEISLPPLRKHQEDIPELCEFFVVKNKNDIAKYITGIDSSVYPLLYSYSWPGNIRELEHVIESACIMAYDGKLYPHHFNFLTKRISLMNMDRPGQEHLPVPAAEPDNAPPDEVTVSLRERNMREEKKRILSALEQCSGNVSAAAQLLRINRTSLYRKIKRYGIKL